MADAVITVVVERVAAILEDQIRYQVNLVRGVKEELRDLSAKLQTITYVLDDAEKRGPKEQNVKRWLKKLEDTAYEMDDILDEWNYTLLKYNLEDPAAAKQKVCCSFIPSSCLCFKKVSDRRKTAKKIQNVKASLDRILKERDDFKFEVSQPTTEPLRLQSTSLIDIQKVHGEDIDRNKNDIVRKLLMDNNGDTQLIVCVVGMGGIGKTTLAQLVFNDTQVNGFFDLRIWICVSDPFDVAGIARGIVESVTKENIPQNFSQLELVLQKLSDSISGKKFFLVLDDVWTEDHNKWKPLKTSLDDGARGSKILVTTRKDGVAKMMMRGNVDVEIYRPKKLTGEECWTLLRRISLSRRSERECREFENVGKKIAGKCEGLPLAANVLGGLLESKKSLEEWENVLESEIWQMEEAEKELFPHLVLSYNELSPTLKRCFSYCAVYPKDYRINVQYLIEEWMALGYLGSVAGKGEVKVNGRDYFNNLARRSFFQDFERSSESEVEEIEWCKMHDIVHDFAQFLRNKIQNDRAEAPGMTKRSCQVCNPLLRSQAQEYRSLVWDEESATTICDCVTSVRVLRFGMYYWLSTYGLPHGMKKLIHLRWLKLSETELSKEDLNIICRLYFLQTLLLERCSIEEIPGEIRNLVELRHLDLSENFELKELPESMCSLVELRILNIERCFNLCRLPEEIHRLKNLQHLLIGIGTNHFRFPQGVGELSDLRTLKLSDLCGFRVGSGWNKLGWLKNLNRLTGSLNLEYHINSIGDLEELVEDAREAELRNKVHIQRLEINFFWSSSSSPSSSLWIEVMEALEPNLNLNHLYIFRYFGSKLPDWISSPINFIKQIELKFVCEVSSLPPMGKLPFLEILRMQGLVELKLVGREFLGIECSSSSSSSSSSSTSSNDVVVAFPKLEQLRFFNCSNWSEWEDITAEEEESAAISIMPCLTDLEINTCEGLKKLPHRLLRKASSSSSKLMVYIFDSPELIKSYGGEDGSMYLDMPCRNNPQLDIL